MLLGVWLELPILSCVLIGYSHLKLFDHTQSNLKSLVMWHDQKLVISFSFSSLPALDFEHQKGQMFLQHLSRPAGQKLSTYADQYFLTIFQCLSNATNRPAQTPLTPAECLIHTLTKTLLQYHCCSMPSGPRCGTTINNTGKLTTVDYIVSLGRSARCNLLILPAHIH